MNYLPRKFYIFPKSARAVLSEKELDYTIRDTRGYIIANNMKTYEIIYDKLEDHSYNVQLKER